MKKLLVLLALTFSFSVYGLSLVPACESKDINQYLDKMLGEIEKNETAEEFAYARYVAEFFARSASNDDGFHCCSNSSLKVCQEIQKLKEVE